MPLATSPLVFTSSLSSSKLCTTVEEFHQGKICKESNRASSSQFQKGSAMRDMKTAAATEHVESFTKLPNLRILEVLGATQPSKYIESVVAPKQSNNASACVAMTVAVAEFKGPEVHGVVRFAQESSGQQECSIEVVVDGLAPGAHGWSVHEFGDLTRGPLSTGAAYAFPPPRNSSISLEQGRNAHLGNLGLLLVDSHGHVQSTATNDRLIVADIIGRSVVFYGDNGDGNGNNRVAAAVVARSARPSSLNPQLCHCDGSLLWQGNANSRELMCWSWTCASGGRGWIWNGSSGGCRGRSWIRGRRSGSRRVWNGNDRDLREVCSGSDAGGTLGRLQSTMHSIESRVRFAKHRHGCVIVESSDAPTKLVNESGCHLGGSRAADKCVQTISYSVWRCSRF